jgi:UDP-N-acetylglucosamine--N-acetylmuramyl-(pentapeptide) pyrophosphoryl-undecaprenol N-acetylglucosamine transferase
VAGGGTAGHILAALEFLKAYRREFGADGFLIGCGEPLERRLAEARGERVEAVPGLPFARQGLVRKVAAAAAITWGVSAARRILARNGAQLVIGAGGYGSFNACLAARSLGLPVVIHEANVKPGIANRILARLANRICVGFPETAAVGGRKAMATGNPGTAGLRQSRGAQQLPLILVTGGTFGSPLLNRQAPALFAALQRRGIRFSVLHLAGIGHRGPTARAYREAGVPAQVEEFVDDIAELYASSHFAISAAGAMTIADLAAAGVPALLVPQSAAASGHQIWNARAYAERAGAYWVHESQWSSEAQADWIAEAIGDPQRLESMRRKALVWARPHAARDVVRICEELRHRAKKAGRVNAQRVPAN